MAKTSIVYKNGYLSIGGSDISQYVRECELSGEYDEVDQTAWGDEAHWGIPGLGNWSINVRCKQSFASGELDAIIWPLLGSASASAVILKPNGSTTSVNNPKWTGQGRIYGYAPISGAVGAGAEISFTIKCGDGQMIERATSD